MQDFLIACFMIAVCAMGAWVALSGAATQSQLRDRDQNALPNDAD